MQTEQDEDSVLSYSTLCRILDKLAFVRDRGVGHQKADERQNTGSRVR
jgi:hypothetical protein